MVDGIIRVFEFFIVSEQVRCIDRFMFIGENNAPFDHVLQFADVTRPVVGHDGIDGSLRESGQLALVKPVKLIKKVRDQQRKILAPFAQRRHVNRENIEAKE